MFVLLLSALSLKKIIKLSSLKALWTALVVGSNNILIFVIISTNGII